MKVRPHWFADRFAAGCAVAVACCFGGCNEQSQELDERVTQLQKELDRTQTELHTANQSLKAAQDEVARLNNEPPHAAGPAVRSPAPPGPNLPSREALEKSYTAKAKVLKQELQERLKQFTVDTCTLYNIQMPSPEFPVTSKVTVSLRSSAGNSFKLDVPGKADPAGNWYFPDVGEIVKRIEDVGKNTAGGRSPAPQTTPRSPVVSAPQEQGRRGPGLGADRTSVIRWPDSSPAASQQTQPTAAPQAPAQAPAPAPSTRAAPQSGGGGTQGLPADRTVVIQWPDGGRSSTGTNQRNPPGPPPNPAASPPPKQSPAEQNVLTQF